jgi:hypothetical protein
MCSIIGSFKKEKLIDLYKHNVQRGDYAHSISYYDVVTGKLTVNKYEGPVNFDNVEQSPLVYIIIHSQAPTTQETSSIHPAHYDGRYLWHNGILKQTYIQKLKKELEEVCEWDTFLMLKTITQNRDNLNNLDGTFSCLLYDYEHLYLFRNEISPMFYDAALNLSSTPFKGSHSTPPNTLHHMDFNFSSLFAVSKFITLENPYYIGD